MFACNKKSLLVPKISNFLRDLIKLYNIGAKDGVNYAHETQELTEKIMQPNRVGVSGLSNS
jgi:hypothetical protein